MAKFSGSVVVRKERRRGLVEVEEIPEEPAASLSVATAMTIVVPVAIVAIPVVVSIPIFTARRRGGRCRGGGRFRRPIDQFVELAAIQPDPTAFRAIVDLDALSLGHQKIRFHAHGAFHTRLRLVRCPRVSSSGRSGKKKRN
nr:hypothetical protein [Sulfurifustis variabilis]